MWSHPNCKIRYQLSKKAKEEGKAVTELLQKGHFDRVSYHAKVEEMFAIFLDDLEASESRIDVFNGIMDVLEDDSVSLIGVYGFAGIGKSRLIKEVARKVKQDKFFDAVVLVVVTKTPENKKIQDQIAEQLGFGFYGLEEYRRAHLVFREMKRMKKILVILDDIWVRLDLDTIGIPYGHHHEGCKILLASRSLNLLYEMNTQRNFSVGILEPEAAWDLFKKIGGDGVDESPDLQSTVVEVAEECGGLPIAISMVARALRNKSSREWRAALQKLKRPSKNKRALEVIQSAVKLSFDHLISEELEFALVLCCLMGNNAAIEDFLKYGMGLNLFNGIKTIEEARDKALALVLELKESFLLLDSYTDKLFDVYDAVRDVAISIASENHHFFIIKDEDVDWSQGKKIEGSNVIVLQNANIRELPSRLNCPQLKFFYLGCKNPSSKIPTGFFNETQELKVLHLNNVMFSSLPSSIRVLAKLSTLCLHDCLLEDIKIIGELWNLEILSLSGSDIEKLPREIGNLTRLRLLDLNNCIKLKYIPPRTLSSLSRLEELYMRKSFCRWEIEGDGRNASLAELKELSHLTCLDIRIPYVNTIPEDLFSGRLSRYRIVVGYEWDGSPNRKYESSRKVVHIENMSSYHFGDGFKELLNQTEELYLDRLRSGEDLHYIFEGQSFQHLKNLHLDHIVNMQYLLRTNHEAFPILESLFLVDMPYLVKICRGTREVKLFDRLRIVKVDGCDSLENLFSVSIFRNLFQLEEIEVVDCGNIIELFADEREEFEENPIISNIQSLKLKRLPQLISFSMQQWIYALRRKSEALFNEKIVFPCLEDLHLFDINIERIWHNQLATTSCCGQNLRSLIVERCDNLKYLLSHPAAGCLVQLKRLQIIGCKGMEEIIEAEEKLEEISEAKILFPQLNSLRMENLPNLRGFYFGNSIIEFPDLKKVVVEECPKLKIFSHGVLTPKLRNVTISGGEDRVLQAKDLNATIQQFYKEQAREDGTESKGKLNVEAGPSGTQGEEAVHGKAIPSDKNVEALVSPKIDVSSPATSHGSDQRPVPKKAGVIDEAKSISGLVSELDSPYPISVDVEVTRETATTPVEKPLSAAERVLSSSLTAENPEIIPDGNEGTSSIHEIENEATAGLTEPPTEKEWEKSKEMFLMDNKLSTLPEKPNCPQLEMLFLQRNYQLRVVPDLFFDNMPSLKLLNLSKTRIKYLPKSISKLERLETLILRDCERLIKLPSEVGSLKLLQVLDLGGTVIIELPEEIAELDSLSHLEVSLYGSSTNSEHVKLPPQLISRLQALETLRISVYPGDNWWNKSVESFVEEVSNLKKLTSLSFFFPEVKFLELFLRESASWKEERLTEFKLVVGRDIKFNAPRVPLSVELNYGSISGQCLRFVNSEKIPPAISEVLARCTAFYLDHHLDILRLSDFGIGNINKLKYCIISECPCLETIVDSKEGTEVVFPCLEHLSIHYSWSLKCIWEGVVPKGSFAALRTLSLHACPKLTYVFKSSMLQFISNLEELQVDDCEAIENIVSSEETSTESCCISLKSLTLHYLPELVHIWEGAQTKLLFEYISVYDCPQLKQSFIGSELKQTLKEIRAEKDWWDELVWEETAIRSDFEAIFTPILEGDVQ